MRILIADHWPNVQSALRLLLEQQPGCEVVGEVHEAGQLLARVAEQCPDVVLLGWELAGLGGGALLADLRTICPGLCVVALSGRADARQAALDAGADAFVSKVAPPERLLSVVLTLDPTESRERRLTMVEVERSRKLRYVAVIAVAVVLLACVAAGLTVSLVLINEIPFQHIWPH
jgi:DNA-binding NarL/FixJ family response regulator